MKKFKLIKNRKILELLNRKCYPILIIFFKKENNLIKIAIEKFRFTKQN